MDADAHNEAPPEPWLAEAVATLQQPVALDGAYWRRALAALEPPVRGPARRWRLAVALPFAAAAGLALMMQPGHRAGTEDGRAPVAFHLSAPAREVALVGDFNDWDPAANRLERHGSSWNLTLRLPPGRYRYAYLVDGQRWLPDPGLPAAGDDFGTPTSVITVAH